MTTETPARPRPMRDLAGSERHPFAATLRTVGRGPTLSRPLTEGEAEAAMGMVLDGEVEPLQLGAFLLLLRYRGETAEELAGFVRAARARLVGGVKAEVDLDWPSYADAHKQLPYFLLAALLLARNGYRVLVHGVAGEGAATTRHGLAALGLAQARSPAEAAAGLDGANFAYLPVEAAVPELARLLGLKPFLGLRTFANTMTRELNPFGAACQMQGVFHPPYLELHRGTQRLLGQPRAATFKGGGGEGQRNPEKPCRVLELDEGGEAAETVWPALTPGAAYPWRDEPLEPSRLAAVWRGDVDAPALVACVTGTAAVALRLLGRHEPGAAQTLAEAMWRGRDKELPDSP